MKVGRVLTLTTFEIVESNLTGRNFFASGIFCHYLGRPLMPILPAKCVCKKLDSHQTKRLQQAHD